MLNSHPEVKFASILDGYHAVSNPSCAAFSEEFVFRYPDDKVIHTIRDSADVWLEEVLRTVWEVYSESPFATKEPLGSMWVDVVLSSPFRMDRRMYRILFDEYLLRTGKEFHDTTSRVALRMPSVIFLAELEGPIRRLGPS